MLAEAFGQTEATEASDPNGIKWSALSPRPNEAKL